MNEEYPDKILNKLVMLESIEAGPNGLIPNLTIEAVVKTHEVSKYYLEFLLPIEINGNIEKSAWISARHVGAPISKADKNRTLSINGKFASGEQFLAQISLK